MALPAGDYNSAIGLGLFDSCLHIVQRLQVDEWTNEVVGVERTSDAQIVVRLTDAIAHFVNA